MLSLIELLEDTASDQGLNFDFASFKETNTILENFDLNISTILVNTSTILEQEENQGNNLNEDFSFTIACVRKREVEETDSEIFKRVMPPTKNDFTAYLNTLSKSPILRKDIGKRRLETIFFQSTNPSAGWVYKGKISPICTLP